MLMPVYELGADTRGIKIAMRALTDGKRVKGLVHAEPYSHY